MCRLTEHSGFSLYSQAIIGQTPCYTVLPTELNTNAASAAISSITAQIAATASTGSTPTISVVVITNQVFALSLPHTPHKSQLGVKVGAGVGAAGSGSTPITSFNSGGMSQQPSLLSTGPTQSTGPSPPELPNNNYPPWTQYGLAGAQQPHAYQQAQYGQPWPQTSGSVPSSLPGNTGTEVSEGFPINYREMPGSQTNVYETNANLPRPGISKMPDGRVYIEPVEIGQK
jgi:hypothetical protein